MAAGGFKTKIEDISDDIWLNVGNKICMWFRVESFEFEWKKKWVQLLTKLSEQAYEMA